MSDSRQDIFLCLSKSLTI